MTEAQEQRLKDAEFSFDVWEYKSWGDHARLGPAHVTIGGERYTFACYSPAYHKGNEEERESSLEALKEATLRFLDRKSFEYKETEWHNHFRERKDA